MALERYGDSFYSKFNHRWDDKDRNVSLSTPGQICSHFKVMKIMGLRRGRGELCQNFYIRTESPNLRVPVTWHGCVPSGSKCVRSECAFFVVFLWPHWLSGGESGVIGVGIPQDKEAWIPALDCRSLPSHTHHIRLWCEWAKNFHCVKSLRIQGLLTIASNMTLIWAVCGNSIYELLFYIPALY